MQNKILGHYVYVVFILYAIVMINHIRGCQDHLTISLIPSLPKENCALIIDNCTYRGQMRLFLTSKAGLPLIKWWYQEREKRHKLFVNYFNNRITFDKQWQQFDDNYMSLFPCSKMNKGATCLLWVEKAYDADCVKSANLINGTIVERNHSSSFNLDDLKDKPCGAILAFDQNGDPDFERAQRLYDKKQEAVCIIQITWMTSIILVLFANEYSKFCGYGSFF